MTILDSTHKTAKPVELVAERHNTHGDWFDQSYLASLIKADMHGTPGWHRLGASHREALDMIAVKVSRIITGNPGYADHWDDIMGYALLGKSDRLAAIKAEEAGKRT